jgi:transposase
MDIIEYRAVIKFLTLKGNSFKDIHEQLVSVYGGSTSSYTTVTKWAREFKRGRQILEDDPRERRPQTAITEENISTVEELVMKDRRMSIRRIGEELGISLERVNHI